MKDITFSNVRACEPKPIPYYIGCIKSRKSGIVPNTYSFNLPVDFSTTSAIDTWLHAIDDTVTSITYLYPPATSNPTTPINCTEVSTIQAWLDSLGIGITYNINNFDEIVLVYDNISEVSRWSFWLGGSAADNYTNKLSPTVFDVQTDEFTYTEVQVVKEVLDEEYRDRYFVVTDNPLQEVFFDSTTQRFSFGNCPNCQNEIFATHQRFYEVAAVPVGAVAYEMTNDLPTQGLDVSNSYFHLIYPTLNGITSDPIGAQLTEYFANVQSGILWSDIAGVQAVIDYVLPSMGLSAGDVIYAINTTNLPIFLLSPTAVAELANNTFLHIYWGAVDTHSNYNEKADATVIAANPVILTGNIGTICVPIQEIKEKDSCTGLETYRYITENGTGNLVNASSVITGFDETKVLLNCKPTDCGQFTSNCMCYGSDTNASDYVYALDPNQGTEGGFGMGTDTLKWNTSGNLTPSIPYIDNCISGGGEATITITDQDGNIVIFLANGFITPQGSTPFAAYSGTGTGGFSGKIRAVTISCSSNAAGKGKACQWISCDKLTTKWFNGTYELIQEEIDTLVECTIPVSIEPECEINLVQVQGCASEATAEVTIGDLILTIAKQDCNNVILSSQQFNVSQSNLLLTIPVQTENCNPQPSITQTEECILDAKKQKWTEITIVQGVNTTVIYVNQDTLEIGVPIGLPNEWTSCDVECNLTPDCCYCFCAMTLPITRTAVKKEALAKETKAVATTKPVKVTICITNWRDCTQTVVKRTYTIDGVDVPEATFLKLKYTKTVCTDPIPTFTPGTPTCGTYVDTIYGVVILNVTIFTNDINPTDTFTIYNLADNYTGLGNIGDVYLPADETLVSACNCSPLIECITTTEECYKALSDVKGVANIGDTITVKITTNAITNTDYYEIIHSTTNSLIYAGIDPVTDIGLDINNTLIWELSPCDPPAPEVFDILEREVCGTIDGSIDTYELIRIYTRNPTTGVSTTLFYEDNKGNQITGVVVEVCCTCDTLCDVSNIIVPLPNQRCIGYRGNNDPNISASGWMISGRYNPANWVGTCGSAPTTFTWELLSCIVSGVELLTTPVVVTVSFASMTLTASGIPTNYATVFNALPELAGNDIVLDPDMTVYNWNTTKPFLLGFRQYTSDNICTPALTGRIDFIKGGVSDGWDFAISSNLVDMQTKTMSIYNDPSINYPHLPVNSCVAI